MHKRLVKLIERENLFWKMTSPSKSDPFQVIRRPPEAPIEGRKANLLSLLGQKFLM